MAGYYNNPEATARAIDADGWLHTGDLARRRDDGNYRIVGRSKELIIRGGENIYPAEVEEFLHRHPAVAEVAVAGLPDAKYGEVVAAWVVAKSGAMLHSRRAEALLPGPDRPLQGPAVRHDRREPPQDRDRQDPQARPARIRRSTSWGWMRRPRSRRHRPLGDRVHPPDTWIDRIERRISAGVVRGAWERSGWSRSRGAATAWRSCESCTNWRRRRAYGCRWRTSTMACGRRQAGPTPRSWPSWPSPWECRATWACGSRPGSPLRVRRA